VEPKYFNRAMSLADVRGVGEFGQTLLRAHSGISLAVRGGAI